MVSTSWSTRRPGLRRIFRTVLPLVVVLLLGSNLPLLARPAAGPTAQQDPNAPAGSMIVASSTNYGEVRTFPVADVVSNLGISAWRQQGWTGLNVPVGILDVGFGGLTAFEDAFEVDVSIPVLDKAAYDSQTERHGTEVLEVIKGIAPNAPLYACSYENFDGYTQCIDWFIRQRVRIINHSVGVPALPLDGSNEWAREVERASREQILWVNAAGNFANGYIDGIFTPMQSGNPYTVFLGGGQLGDTLKVPVISSTPVRGRILLSWTGVNNVAANAIDLDLELYYAGSNEAIFSQGRQNGQIGDLPIELLTVELSQEFYLKIRDVSGNAPGARYVLFVEFASLPGGKFQQSIIAPGDSPFSLTVGALQNNLIAPYSSRGPLITNQLKPDLVAPGEIRLADGTQFVGTSAAAPVVAGVAALIWEANPGWTREQMYTYLREGATLDDSEIAGTDGNYGFGRLNLPTNIPSRALDTGVVDTTSSLGKLPFRNNFEESGIALDQWDYDASVWQVTRVGGSNVLVGQGKLESPIFILNGVQSEWLNPQLDGDLIVSFDFNLQRQSGGLRYVFRYNEDAGYNALELFPGRIILKRNNLTDRDFLNREAELSLNSETAPISEETWHNIRIWLSGRQIYIYLDRQLIMRVADPYTPELFAGEMLFQVNQPFRQVRVDNFLVQKAERASDHFETATLPATWSTSDTVRTTIGQEDNGNQFVRLNGDVTLTPSVPELQDLRLSCRLWSEQGGYEIRVRETEDGALRFKFEGGNLEMAMVDDLGDRIWFKVLENFYNRGRWDDITFIISGSRLEIYRDGRLRFAESIGGRAEPEAGLIQFSTDRQDIMRVDDCLITEILE